MLLSYIDNSNVINYFTLVSHCCDSVVSAIPFGTLDIDRGCVDFPPCVPE